MDKKELLDSIQAAKDHLDQAAEGRHEIGNILNAVARLADAVQRLIEAQLDNRTIGDVINELATRTDIDIYTLERALAKRCFPDRDEYICVEVDHRLPCDSPGYKAERQRSDNLLKRIDETLKRTGQLD